MQSQMGRHAVGWVEREACGLMVDIEVPLGTDWALSSHDFSKHGTGTNVCPQLYSCQTRYFKEFRIHEPGFFSSK